jgi:hypothetical protein
VSRAGCVELDGPGADCPRDAAPVELHGRPVIVAVPWHALPQVMAGDTTRVGPVLAAAAATRPVSIVSVNLWFDRQVLDVPMLGIEGRSFQWAFAREGYVSLVMSGADAIVRERNDTIATLALADLRHAVPAARAQAPTRTMAIREPRATLLRPTATPGRRHRRRQPARERLGRTGLPATIEAQPSPAAGPPNTSCRRAEVCACARATRRARASKPIIRCRQACCGRPLGFEGAHDAVSTITPSAISQSSAARRRAASQRKRRCACSKVMFKPGRGR